MSERGTGILPVENRLEACATQERNNPPHFTCHLSQPFIKQIIGRPLADGLGIMSVTIDVSGVVL